MFCSLSPPYCRTDWSRRTKEYNAATTLGMYFKLLHCVNYAGLKLILQNPLNHVRTYNLSGPCQTSGKTTMVFNKPEFPGSVSGIAST